MPTEGKVNQVYFTHATLRRFVDDRPIPISTLEDKMKVELLSKAFEQLSLSQLEELINPNLKIK